MDGRVGITPAGGDEKTCTAGLKLHTSQTENFPRTTCSVRPHGVCRMKDTHTLPFVDVDSLRIGMFVHIELGWMSHPFPLSSFRLSSPDQIATIRGLGLKRLRWNPQLSAAPSKDSTEATPSRPAADDADAAAPVLATAEPPRPADSETPEARAQRLHRESLVAQREALRLCEKQFSEATQAFRRITDGATANPLAAGHLALALSQALRDKMLGHQDLSIRLLTEAAGDKASAHAVNVALVSMLLGRHLGFSESELLDLGVGALMHDIGKLDLPERLRHEDSQLSASEHKVYQDHVAHGVARARRLGLSDGAAMVIAQHHEMADGSGFPMRVENDAMTAAARIVALVNRYDNLCNPNLMQRAMTPHQALSLIFANTHQCFDATILNAFIKMMGVYPAGSLVQLTDGRFAMVVGVNASRPLKHQLLVHEARVPREEALIMDLERHACLGIRRSVASTALPADSLIYLSPRQRVAYFFEPSPLAESEAA